MSRAPEPPPGCGSSIAARDAVRTSGTTGHGSRTQLTERIDQEVDVYAFLFERLGMKPAVAERPAAPPN